MNCLKCGRETEESQVFCPSCLEDMARCPVRPGTPVVLPHRKAMPVSKKPPKRRSLTPEDQVRTLRKQVRFLIWLTSIAIILAMLFAIPAMQYAESKRVRPGQNYSVVPSGGTSRRPLGDRDS